MQTLIAPRSPSFLIEFSIVGFLLLAQSCVIARADISTHAMRPNASTNSQDFGLGIMLGEPSGITGKYWFSSTDAVDFGFAYSFNNYTALFSDYLWHFPNAFNTSSSDRVALDFIPYVGVGPILFVSGYNNDFNQDRRNHFFTSTSGNSLALGARIPLGIEFLPRTAPLGLFVEVDPGVGVIPGTFGFIEAEIGGRFYF